MKVNYNMSAMVTNNQLMRTENGLTKVMERLSSGLKLNHAKDDPAGMAISNKMKLQIDGLDQASRNASDGTSVLQTADGALDGVTNLLQRMRELSVQAATDTNSLAERRAIQDEIDSLVEEVDRISQDTEFNTKALLNGTLDVRVYAKNVSRVTTSTYVEPGMYDITVEEAATKGNITADAGTFTDMAAEIGTAGWIKINNHKISVEATDTYEQVYEKLREGAEIGEAEADITEDGELSITAYEYGTAAKVKLEMSSPEFATALGFDETEPPEVEGTDAQITLENGFEATTTVSADGNRIAITDKNGFEIQFMVNEGFPEAGEDGSVQFEVTEIGSMYLQIGANEHQTMEVRIPRLDSETLYLDKIDVTTVNGANKALDEFDRALSRVLSVRSSIGACENRLDYAVGSLDETSENVTAALSRIQDADMAEEMTNFTQYNVLEQAAISVLTQANELPQQTLQLLQ